jgi:alpha-1,6-mannosyltransferase
LKSLDITKFFGETTGGIRTYLLEKAKYVARQSEIRQVVIVPAQRAAVRDEGHTRWYRLAGIPIPTQAPYRAILSTRKIRAILEVERPDIIEVGSPYVVPWITRRAARPLSIPLVWFYHTNFPRIISPRPGRDGVVRRTAGRLADRYVATLAGLFHGAIGASQAAVDALVRAGFRHVERIPLGVDLEHFHPRRRGSAERTRAMHGLPHGPVAIYVGRLAREKELELVIDAWPAVERATAATLVLVGDGPSRRHYHQRSKGNRVVWLPYEKDRERIADLLAAADVYLAPGPAETFGLAALEALASGTPVIASDQGAVRELITSSGAGMVNAEPTAGAMAGTIIGLLGQDLAYLGDRGRKYAEANHAWDGVFDRLFAFYRGIIERARA